LSDFASSDKLILLSRCKKFHQLERCQKGRGVGREFLPTPVLRRRRSIPRKYSGQVGVGNIGICAASLIAGRRRNIIVFARKKFERNRANTTKVYLLIFDASRPRLPKGKAGNFKQIRRNINNIDGFDFLNCWCTPPIGGEKAFG